MTRADDPHPSGARRKVRLAALPVHWTASDQAEAHVRPVVCRTPRPRLPAVAILLAAVLWSGSSLAQPDSRWRLVGQSPSVRLHYDPSTLVREGDIRKVRELQDLDAPDPDGVRSRVYLNEYDCRNQMHRLGQMQSYAGPMLSGERRFDVREMGYWRRIPGGSVFAQVYQQVCPDGQTLRAAEEPPPLQRLFGPR